MTNENLLNRYFIDGIDLYAAYGLSVSSGSDGFMKFPKRKDSIKKDWSDEDGLDIDLSRPKFEQKVVQLKCFILADDEQDFWSKYDSFRTKISEPGLRRLTIAQLSRDFYVYYTETGEFSRFTRIKDVDKIACSFTITLVEQIPGFNNVPTFIVDEDGRFLIT